MNPKQLVLNLMVIIFEVGLVVAYTRLFSLLSLVHFRSRAIGPAIFYLAIDVVYEPRDLA